MANAGFIAAKVSWDALGRALESRGGSFATGASVSASELDPRGVYAGEFGGAAYIHDGEMVFSSVSSPDFFANLSRELDTLVAVGTYETVSGTFELLAVQKGELVRCFSSSATDAQPLSLGKPLGSEARVPLSSVEGLVAAFDQLGFNLEGSVSHGILKELVLPDSIERFETEEGPLGLRRARAEHQKRYGATPEQLRRDFQIQAKVEQTGDGQFIFSLGTVKKPWHHRLRDWLGL